MGRKLALICVNIPYVVAWILLYYAQSLNMIYISFMLLGIGLGLMEAPIFTYIGKRTFYVYRYIIFSIYNFYFYVYRWNMWTWHTWNPYIFGFDSCSLRNRIGLFFGESSIMAECSVDLCSDTSFSDFSYFFCELETFHILSSSNNCLLFSCQKHPCGCSLGIVKKRLWNHFVGSVDGSNRKLFKRNSMIYNAVESQLSNAMIVRNWMKNVNIHHQQYETKFVIYFDAEHYGRSFWLAAYSSSQLSVGSLHTDHS